MAKIQSKSPKTHLLVVFFQVMECFRPIFWQNYPCFKEIVSIVEAYCLHFYIRDNRCASLYDDIFGLRGLKRAEINGQVFEQNSILVEKWRGKACRLVILCQRCSDGDLDLWEGEYICRCILINDFESSTREIVEFYKKRWQESGRFEHC